MSTVKTTEPLITDAFLNFSQTIKTPKTRSNYIQALKYYIKFSKIENYDDLLRFSSTPDGLLSIQKNIQNKGCLLRCSICFHSPNKFSTGVK
jgi:hypothetical protein